MSFNAFLDTLPRATFGRYTRPVPAFRTCGVVGFYAAVLVAFAVGLIGRRSPLVLALVCLVAAASFYGWAYLRRRLSGTEALVLLEHVWVAEGCVYGALRAVGEAPLVYLDAMAVGLCVFLAAGRIGCTLVGCCHGRPSSLGIRYGPELVRAGFSWELEGVRLFPVPALEAVALVAIGVTATLAIAVGPPGVAFIWFLVSYAIVRFGLEGLRGDERPHLLRLSVNRWMCIVEAGLALWLAHHALGLAGVGATEIAIAAALGAGLVTLLIALRTNDPERGLLHSSHIDELRNVVRELLETELSAEPTLRRTSHGTFVAVSAGPRLVPETVHVSLSLTDPDLELLCTLTARAFPELDPAMVGATPGLVVHLALDGTPLTERPSVASSTPRALFGSVVRRLQEPPAAPPFESSPHSDYFGGAGGELRAGYRAAS